MLNFIKCFERILIKMISDLIPDTCLQGNGVIVVYVWQCSLVGWNSPVEKYEQTQWFWTNFAIEVNSENEWFEFSFAVRLNEGYKSCITDKKEFQV
jgi:hypothetical protein